MTTTSNQQAAASPSAGELVTTRPRLETLHAIDRPAPGQYWRARTEIEHDNDDRRECPAITAGTILLLSAIERADGIAHVYVFAGHPNWPHADQSRVRIHAEDLFDLFEYEPDGLRLREVEIQRLHETMAATRDQMMQPPPDDAVAGYLTFDPAAAVGVPGQALATGQDVHALIQRATGMRESAKRQADWIAVHSETLGEQGLVLARYYRERALVAKAKASEQLEGVAAILKTVANLQLYVGEGVEVLQLRDGAPAPADASLTVFQEPIQFDEETGAALDQGGLDHTRTDELEEALADMTLVKRMIPAERGVVLCAFRATFKEFVKPATDDVGAALSAHHANAALNRLSQRRRLLIREGERVFLVTAGDLFNSLKQLLPSAGEQAGYFDKHRRDRPITVDDLDYARAQREQLGALDTYAQALVILWGLHDRTDLFEAAGMPRFASWLDPSFQSRFLRVLDQDTLLGVERPSYDDWREAQNMYLVTGAAVAVDLKQAYDAGTAPGGFSRAGGGDPRMIYQPIDETDMFVGRTASDALGLYVQVPCTNDGYGKAKRPITTIKLYVMRHPVGKSRQVARGVLTLDRCRRSDLSYYLESRKQRRCYASYLRLFRSARAWVSDRDAAEAPLRDALRAAVLEAQLPHDAAALDDRITDALAVTRTARRDRQIPAQGSAAFKAWWKAALAALHAGIADHRPRLAAIDAWAARKGRKPLRLVLTGQGTWKLFLVPSTAEHDRRLGPPAHAAWGEVAFTAHGVGIVIQGRAMLAAVAGEIVIHDWNWEETVPAVEWDALCFPGRSKPPRTRQVGAVTWLEHALPFRAPYADAVRLLDAMHGQSAAFDAGIDLADLVRRCERYMILESKRAVERMPLLVPIGALVETGRPYTLFAKADALAYAYVHGDAALRLECVRILGRLYQEPSSHIDAIKQRGQRWEIARVSYDQAVRHVGADPFVTDDIGCYFQVMRQHIAGGRHRVQATATMLTPTGAHLLPELLQIAELESTPAMTPSSTQPTDSGLSTTAQDPA